MWSGSVGGKCRQLILVVLGSALSACAAPVTVPVVKVLAEPETTAKPHLERKPLSPPPPLAADFREAPLRAGERTIYGIVLTPELEQVSLLQAQGRLDEAISQTLAAEGSTTDPMMSWYLAAHRTHLLNLAGRVAEAETESELVRSREIVLRGSDLVARALRGDARARLGEYDRAIADYQTVLKALNGWTFPTSYSGPPSNLMDLAVTAEARTRALLGMSFVYTFTGRHELALAWAEETERHMADMFHVSNHPLYGSAMGRLTLEFYMGRAVNLAFLGASLLASGSADRVAEPFFAAALSYFSAINYAHGPVHVSALRAMGLLRAGRVEEAGKVARVAAGQAEQSGLVDFVWRIEALAGEALLGAGRKAEAESSLRSAQGAVDRITGLIGSDREKRRFGVGKDDITYRLAQLDFDRNDPAQLYQDMERGRARAFVDMLATVNIASGDPDVEAIRAIDDKARIMVSAIESGIGGGSATVHAAATGQTRAMGILAAKLDPLVRERAAAVERLRLRDPALAETRGLGTASLEQIRSALKADELLIYFLPARAEDEVRALMISRSKAWLKGFPLSAAQLGKDMSAFAAALAAEDAKTQTGIGRKLSQVFDVASWHGYGAVLIVPSGIIHSVPWGITAAEVPVVVVPTGSWPGRVSDGGFTKPKSAVVIGDPDFRGKATQLPGARIEAERVAGLYGTQAIMGAAATESGLRAAVGNGVDVLHLATHGKFFGVNPLRSAIYLAGASPLTAARLFEKPLPARVVVLSACETGVGHAEAGDDFLGIPRSLYLGGTQAVLSSLWPVDDNGTLAFMEAFHREAAKGDLGRAWLNARNRLRLAGHPPSIYGAFQLGGSR
ncbi:MAG: CHAT domain-containing protein [Sulfuritalea sp.]|nr:CHAT domain-containing protein [Sulfuritalea sp.]